MKFSTRSGKLLLVGCGLALGLLGASTPSQAQLRYNVGGFTNLAGTYTPVSGGAAVISITGNSNDGLSAANPLNISFPYNGKTMTHFILGTNGFIKLGTSASMSGPSGTLPGNAFSIGGARGALFVDSTAQTSTDPLDEDILSVFNYDLQDGNIANPFPFTYETAAGVTTIQFANRKDQAALAADEMYGDLNFQIRLYGTASATPGRIEYVYGAFAAGTNATAAAAAFLSASIGIKGSVSDVAGFASPEGTLSLTKGASGSGGAWSGISAQYTMPAASTIQNQGINQRARNTTSPFAAVPALMPTSGLTFRFDPDNFATLKYSPVTAEVVGGTYTDLGTNGTAITITSGTPDDGNSSELPIGFSFPFNGGSVDRFILNTNGYLKLGTTGMSAPTANLFSATSGAPIVNTGALFSTLANNNNLLVPFNMDLQPGVSGTEYRVFTNAGVCTIQWKNVRDKQSSGTDADVAGGNSAALQQLYGTIEFQVKLYQATGNVEFQYGTFVFGTDANRKATQIGIKGQSSSPNQILAANTVGGNYLTAAFSRTIYANINIINTPLLGNSVARLPTPGQTFRFPVTFANDLRAEIVYTLGKLPTPFANPTPISGVVRNVGENDYVGGGTASLNLTGANTASNTATIPAIVAGGSAVISFGDFSPTNVGTNTVTLAVPADDNAGNNSRAVSQEVNVNTYSYKDPLAVNSGGVGFNGGTGVFVAKFNSNASNVLNSVKVDFQAPGGIQYNLVVYADNAGVPGALRYISPILTSPSGGGTAQLNICPSLVVTGDFYVGVRQFGTSNVNFSYQTESPIRSGTFFFTSPVANGGVAVNDPSINWSDFFTSSSPFRLSVEAILENASAAPNCAVSQTPVSGTTFVSRDVNLAWGANPVGTTPANYDVYFGTSPNPPLIGEQCGNTYDPPSTLAANTTYYYRIVPKVGSLEATGCAVNSFTTAPLPTNDNCGSAILITPCAGGVSGFSYNGTQSLPGVNCNGTDNANDDVWFRFVATSATHRISVEPNALDVTFNAVIDVLGSCGGASIICSDLRPAGFGEEINVGGLTPGTTYLIRVYGAGASGTEGRFTITVTTDGGWTGATSTDWNTATNWCDGAVPVAATTAQISSTAPNQPILPSTSTILNLSLDAGSQLTLNTGAVLNVQYNGGGGTITGAGGQVVGDGIVNLTATSAQRNNITGTTELENLQISNATGVNVGVGTIIIIDNALTNAAATTLTNNGTIAFNSTATKTGFMGSWAGSTYNGTGNMGQFRFVTGSPRWLFLGSPVQNATLNQWSELAPRIIPLNNASAFFFQETDSSRTIANLTVAEEKGWRVPTALSNGINPGAALRGYRVYARSAFFGNGSLVYTAGTPYVGNVVANVTRTAGQYDDGGYNLISNPYMSTIDWDALTLGSGVNNAFFVYNGAASNYQVYVGAGGNSEGVALNSPGPNPNHIASSQSFFIRTASNSTITFTESAKVANGARSFFRSGPVVDRLRITGRDSRGHSDEAVIRFRTGATDGVDVSMDATTLGSDFISVASVAPNTSPLDVNSLPLLAGRRSVYLDVTVSSAGTYALDFSERETFESYVDMVLVDHFTGTTTNLRNQASYTFQVSANPASQGTSRFEVVFSDARVTSVKTNVAGSVLSAWPNPVSNGQKVLVAVSGTIKGAATLEVIDQTGRTVHTQELNLSGDANQSYEVSTQLASGSYSIRCTSATATMATRLVVNQ